MSHINNIKHFAVDHIIAGQSTSEMCKATHLSPDTVDHILHGKPARLVSVQKFAAAYGRNFAQIMLDSGEDPDAYAEADMRYFADNIKAAVNADIRSTNVLEREMQMPLQSLRRFYQGTMPCTDTLQTMADVLHIGVADLFLPTDALHGVIKTPDYGVQEPRPGQLSHVAYANARIKALIAKMGTCAVAAQLGNCAPQRVEQFARGGRMRYRTMVAMGAMLDLSIGEVLLRPGTDTEWYVDCDAKYFSANVIAVMDELGVTAKELGKRIGVSSSSVGAWRDGAVIPYSDNLQRLADVLDMEVADLFLPPE